MALSQCFGFGSLQLVSHLDPQWNVGKNYRRRLFLQEIGRALIEPHLLQRSRIPQPQKSVQEAMNAVGIVRPSQQMCEEQQPREDRGRCVFCPLRKRVRQRCDICDRFVCETHGKKDFVCYQCRN